MAWPCDPNAQLDELLSQNLLDLGSVDDVLGSLQSLPQPAFAPMPPMSATPMSATPATAAAVAAASASVAAPAPVVVAPSSTTPASSPAANSLLKRMVDAKDAPGVAAGKEDERERRLARNRVSARHSRLRRKEYLQGLEGRIDLMTVQLEEKDRELGQVRAENGRLRDEVAHLRVLLKQLVSPSGSPDVAATPASSAPSKLDRCVSDGAVVPTTLQRSSPPSPAPSDL